MGTPSDMASGPVLKEGRVLITRAEARFGRLRVPMSQVDGTRLARDGILLPLTLIVVFSLLCLSAVTTEDDVGCAVFAFAAILSLMATLFPRHVLMLDAGGGERRVMVCWCQAPLCRAKQAIDGIRLEEGRRSGVRRAA